MKEPPSDYSYLIPDWLTHLQTAVVLLDAGNCLRYLNPAAEDLFGVSGRDKAAVGTALAAIVETGLETDFETGVEALIERAVKDGRVVATQDIEWRRDGRSVWLDIEITALPDGSRLLELHDAELHRRARDDRTRHERQTLSRRVVRQLAHEIRNPLAGLRGAAQLLGRDDSEEVRHELAGIVCREADRLHALVDTLLAPAGPSKMAVGNVHEPVDRLHAMLSAEAGERVSVVRDYDPSLPELALDADQLFQALLNLGRNALQCGADEIRLRTRPANRVTWDATLHRLAVAVEVCDNGPGVPEELAESLFFPLVTGRSDGSGLGLAIAQEIADRHGGKIEFESEPGNTVFRLLLPVSAGLLIDEVWAKEGT